MSAFPEEGCELGHGPDPRTATAKRRHRRREHGRPLSRTGNRKERKRFPFLELSAIVVIVAKVRCRDASRAAIAAGWCSLRRTWRSRAERSSSPGWRPEACRSSASPRVTERTRRKWRNEMLINPLKTNNPAKSLIQHHE